MNIRDAAIKSIETLRDEMTRTGQEIAAQFLLLLS